MLRVAGSIVSVLVIILAISCSNDLDLIEEKVETPVVYGILDSKDTATYIRVEQSFIDPEINAITLAQDPDNLYYDDIEVILTNQTSGLTVSLDQVDGNVDGYPREDGAFAQAPNVLYKVTQDAFPLSTGDIVELTLRNNGDGSTLASAMTSMVDSIFLRKPNVSRPSVGFNAANPAGIEVDFDADEGSDLFDIVFRLYIAEGALIRIIDIPAATNTSDTSTDMPLEDFYARLATELRKFPLTSRQLTGAQIIVTSAGPELSQYIEVGQANLGVTSSQEVPTFTNIENGLGVFSSRSKVTTRLLSPTLATLDSLANGQFTQGLGF